MASKERSPDQIIVDLGGCGRYQACMGIIVHLTKTLISFSIMSMVMITATPKWWCHDDVINHNITMCSDVMNTNSSTNCFENTCFVNNTRCQTFRFGSNVRTAVSEVRTL